MEMALSSKNKMALVDGTMQIPSILEPKYFYWDQCNTMVLSWILRAVSPTIGRSVLWINTAEGIWKDLKKHFSQQDVFRIGEIQSEIHQTKQGTLSANEYFTYQKLLWDELFILRPVPSYGCFPNCECGTKLVEKITSQLESDMLSAFLIGLNENFSSAKHQIMLMKPLPDVGEAFAMISQQERQMAIGINSLANSVDSASAFFTKSDNNGRRAFPNQKQKPVCSYCGYTRHTIDKCYKKHGYPPGWKPKNKGVGSANQSQVSVQEVGSSDSNPLFNQEDYKRFLEFMQQGKANNNLCGITPHVNAISANFIPDATLEGKSFDSKSLADTRSSWILDSGATHHIVCNVH
ncbi:PREDICTED: uncharacterized protein LOC109147116 [Ipomoea nil]|uniref:uncharacterized protein LOC109147116 n=1 Tax=Ipomoea nil TaxID=35883 RepID=UPI0009010D35|nr:PREDICTED: uncharacterized protein LOC109147116 [Ipomoea nil]